MSLNGIKIGKITFELLQDGNTLGSTEEWEELKVSCEYQLPGEDAFFVIKSEKGWSINDSKELGIVIDILQKRVKEISQDLDDIGIEGKVANKLIADAPSNKTHDNEDNIPF